MSKIDLKTILAKHCKVSVSILDKAVRVADKPDIFIEAMKEVWNLAVDECKNAAKLKEEPNYEYSGDSGEPMSYFFIDEDSIEQVKQMIQ